VQATLVSHYGPKPPALAAYLRRCQSKLSKILPSAFAPYAVEQVHATVIGLEGCRRNGQLENLHYRERRRALRHMDPSQLLDFLRAGDVPAFDVRIGGYRKAEHYPFLSQGKHPYDRSFSVQGAIAVAMGWPDDCSAVLDAFRRSFNRLNAWHKWHQGDADVDNDFFLVLGRVDRRSNTDAEIACAEAVMRQFMATEEPVSVTFGRSSLRIVFYSDAQLPLSTSHAYAIDDPALTVSRLRDVYDDCCAESFA